jgi:hypothetical protein
MNGNEALTPALSISQANTPARLAGLSSSSIIGVKVVIKGELLGVSLHPQH